MSGNPNLARCFLLLSDDPRGSSIGCRRGATGVRGGAPANAFEECLGSLLLCFFDVVVIHI